MHDQKLGRRLVRDEIFDLALYKRPHAFSTGETKSILKELIDVSFMLAVLSGMDIARRIALNLVILAAAVGITYLIGTVAKTLWGIGV